MNTYVSAEDRSAMTKTKTPFQSPAGQQVPRQKDADGKQPTTTKKESIGTTPVDHGVNSSQQQNRVPSVEDRDSTTTPKTGHVARNTEDDVSTHSHIAIALR